MPGSPHNAVPDMLFGVPAEPMRADEDEGRVQGQQHGDVLADRVFAPGGSDEHTEHHRRHRQREGGVCDVGVPPKQSNKKYPLGMHSASEDDGVHSSGTLALGMSKTRGL